MLHLAPLTPNTEANNVEFETCVYFLQLSEYIRRIKGNIGGSLFRVPEIFPELHLKQSKTSVLKKSSDAIEIEMNGDEWHSGVNAQAET